MSATVPEADQAISDHVAAHAQITYINRRRADQDFRTLNKWGQPPTSPKYAVEHVIDVLEKTHAYLPTMPPSIGWDDIHDAVDVPRTISPAEYSAAETIRRVVYNGADIARVWIEVFGYGLFGPAVAWNNWTRFIETPILKPITPQQFRDDRWRVQKQWEAMRATIDTAVAAYRLEAAKT